MEKGLLKAASCGDSRSMKEMASRDPSILLGTTPSGNTCLHISCIHGHEVFCTDLLERQDSLLTAVNLDRETPLITAVTCGRVSMASLLLGWYRTPRWSEAILQQDMDGCNALHHAIHNGHEDLALQLVAAEPAMSKHLNKYNESPMFVAVMKDFTRVVEELLQIRDSAHVGPNRYNDLHAAVMNGNTDIATKVIQKRPTTTRLAVFHNKIDVLRVFLEHNSSLGCERDSKGATLLSPAAFQGHVDAARELLKHCPDPPYRDHNQRHGTSLHNAVWYSQTDFVEFILRTPQLQKSVNMRDTLGKTALHYAVKKCDPKMVVALLSHKDIDTAVVDNNGYDASMELWRNTSSAKTLNWNEVFMLISKTKFRDGNPLLNLRLEASYQATDASRKETKSLTQTYTSNTSLVAILIATITFAAAFTLPGGYKSDKGTPIMYRKIAFQAFLISDTLAMCSSFCVAFICILARWEDYEFLVHYISFTKKLMWFAYVATTTAFSTGLYTVLVSHLRWLAIAICLVVALLPVLTKLLGEWPVWKLRIRLGKAYRSDLLDMV